MHPLGERQVRIHWRGSLRTPFVGSRGGPARHQNGFLTFVLVLLCRVPKLEFPAASSYHRLIVHRIADYFMLGHVAAERAVVLFRQPNSFM